MPLHSFQCVSSLCPCYHNASPSFSLPLQLTPAQLYAFAMLFWALPSHCDSIRIPRYVHQRQAIADRNRSSRFSAVPLLIGATLCRSVHRHCGSNRRYSNLRLSQSARILSSPLPCGALRFYSNPRFSFAVQRVSFPLLRCSAQIVTMPLQSIASLYLSYAFYLLAMPLSRYSTFTSQYRCNSKRFRAMPSPGLTIRRPAMPWPFFAPPITSLPQLCRPLLYPRGAYFCVAHRPGPRNMALAYRFHHDQVWQFPHDGADDVDLVRIGIRVPDSVTDLYSVSPPVQRRHGPVDVFIRQCHYSLHSLV